MSSDLEESGELYNYNNTSQTTSTTTFTSSTPTSSTTSLETTTTSTSLTTSLETTSTTTPTSETTSSLITTTSTTTTSTSTSTSTSSTTYSEIMSSSTIPKIVTSTISSMALTTTQKFLTTSLITRTSTTPATSITDTSTTLPHTQHHLRWMNETIGVEEGQRVLDYLEHLVNGTCNTIQDLLFTDCVQDSICADNNTTTEESFSKWQMASVGVSIAIIFIIIFFSGKQNKAKKLHTELVNSLFENDEMNDTEVVDKIPNDPYKDPYKET